MTLLQLIRTLTNTVDVVLILCDLKGNPIQAPSKPINAIDLLGILEAKGEYRNYLDTDIVFNVHAIERGTVGMGVYMSEG